MVPLPLPLPTSSACSSSVSTTKVVGLAPDSAAPDMTTSDGYAGTSPVDIVKCRGVFIAQGDEAVS